MPNMQNRNNRRASGMEQNSTVIMPKVTREMLEKAREMAAQGYSRAEIEAELARIAAAPPAPEPAVSRTVSLPKNRIVPTSRISRRQQKAPSEPEPQETPAPEPQTEPEPEPEIPAEAMPEKPHTNGAPRTRAQAEAELADHIRSDHLFLSNPVMMRSLGIAPAVAAATSGDRALMLCAAALLLVTGTRILAVAICHLTQNRGRPLIYAYSGALLYIPVYLLLYRIFGADVTVLGLYLPLLAVESAVVKRMEFPDLETLPEAARHGFNNGLGFCVVLLIVGAARELLATGMVFGNQIINRALLPVASEPAGGFLLLGLIAAVWVAVANTYIEYKQEEVRRLYAKRNR